MLCEVVELEVDVGPLVVVLVEETVEVEVLLG